MIIKREKERASKLSYDEMVDIFYEIQHHWDEKYLLDLLDMFDDLDSEEFVKMAEQLRNDDALRSRVAYRYRKYLEDIITCDEEYNCMVDAYQYVTKG